jgi:Acetyltransferase (GNAT) domain
MEYRIEFINPLEFPGWDQWAQSFHRHSIFHSRSWAQVLVEAYGYKPYYLILSRQGKHEAAWPIFETNSVWTGKKAVSLPFSDHCEPILEDESCFTDIFDRIVHLARQLKWKTVEFRGGERFFKQHPRAASYNLHLLELCPHEKEMKGRLRSSTRRNINKAVKKKVEITIGTSMDSVRDFYALNCLTRKHHGLPPQPFNFFKKVHRHLISKEMGMVVLARHNHQVVAGAIFFHFGKNATYKYGASHRGYLALRPNNLVMWEAIKWYGRRGFRQFDLGRSEPDNPGLNQFKNGWGATVQQVAYYRYDLNRRAFVGDERSIPRFFNRAFRMMPVPVLRMLGGLAYRHMA